MIIEYHRPKTIEEALELLATSEIMTYPMGGGSALNQPLKESFAVVDLQDLGLNSINDRGNLLDLGATVTLQALMEVEGLQPALIQAVRHEAAYNLRQVGTLAGTLVASNGRSPFTTAFLALDAAITMHPREETHALGELLPLRAEILRGRLITHVTIPRNARLAYQAVSRTPSDQPIVCAAAARWPSGRTRVALGGFGKAPSMAFDGTEDSGAEVAARDAYSHAEDQWASAEYRREMAEVLTRRCLEEVM
jgi:putative selenate reductase FAD-binding subunit